MTRYYIEPRTRKYVKGYMDFYYLQDNIKKNLLDTGLDVSKNVAHKTGEFIIKENCRRSN